MIAVCKEIRFTDYKTVIAFINSFTCQVTLVSFKDSNCYTCQQLNKIDFV